MYPRTSWTMGYDALLHYSMTTSMPKVPTTIFTDGEGGELRPEHINVTCVQVFFFAAPEQSWKWGGTDGIDLRWA